MTVFGTIKQAVRILEEENAGEGNVDRSIRMLQKYLGQTDGGPASMFFDDDRLDTLLNGSTHEKVKVLADYMAHEVKFELAGLDFDAEKSELVNPHDLTYLTNSAAESFIECSCMLRDLDIPFTNNLSTHPYFFPLTESEAHLVSEDALGFSIGNVEYLGRMGYSVLHEHCKWLYFGVETIFSTESGSEFPDKDQALSNHNAAFELLKSKASGLNALVTYSDQCQKFADGGEFYTGLLIPFESAKKHASNYDEWKQWLSAYLKK